MSKTMQYLFDINSPLTWAKGEGRGLPRKEKSMYFKDLAHRRWNQDAIRQVLPKPVILPKEEVVTSSIPAQEAGNLLQVDTSVYPDAVEAFEIGGIRTTKEYTADQLVGRAKFWLNEWIDKREVFLHPVWHTRPPKVTVDMGPDELEAVRQDIQAFPGRVFRSERWRRAKYYERLEDLEYGVEMAAERKLEMYDELDQQLLLEAEAREPAPWADERTKEEAWWDYIRPAMEDWDIEQLAMFMDKADSGLEVWAADKLMLEKMVAEYRVLLFKWDTQLGNVEVTNTDEQGYNIINEFKSPTLESKADEFFALDRKVYQAIDTRRRYEALRPSLLAKVDKVRGKARAKAKAAQEAFWGRQEDPFKVVAVLPGQDLCFEVDGEYLEGSCTEVRYELANGMRVSVDHIPEGDLNDADYVEPEDELFNPVLPCDMPLVVEKPKRRWMKLSDL
jgi:hypothetical protein